MWFFGIVGAAATGLIEVWARRRDDVRDRNQSFLALLAGLPVAAALAARPGRSRSRSITSWLSATVWGLIGASAVRWVSARLAPIPEEAAYNYRRFDYRHYQSRLLEPVAGRLLHAAELTDLEGRTVSLRQAIADAPAVIEFGSISCPIYVGKITAMSRLAEVFGDRARFMVVYTREAHPGPRYPHHQSMGQKHSHASQLETRDNEKRLILIDDLDGSFHRRYGANPNSVMVVGHDGVVAHWSEWNRPEETKQALQRLLAAGGGGAEIEPTEIHHNFVPPREPARELALFFRPGFPAFADFILQLPRMAADRIRRHGLI